MSKAKGIERTDLGQFEKGISGNPVGRPKGSKNKITILKQSMEVALREQTSPHMAAVMDKAIELAIEGDRQMIKLLVDNHMSKGVSEDSKASDKVAIQINAGPAPEVIEVKETIIDSGDTE
jgi:hypothetical protein